jgi:hypothetical protein
VLYPDLRLAKFAVRLLELFRRNVTVDSFLILRSQRSLEILVNQLTWPI